MDVHVQEDKVMDVGSKGGGWTKKSPKLLLLEWTQAQKRPKPRYKTLPENNGTLRCKVRCLDLATRVQGHDRSETMGVLGCCAGQGDVNCWK